MRRDRSGAPRWALAWALGVTAILLSGWEHFAAGFDSDAVALVHEGSVFADATGNDRLGEALDALPAPLAPRIVVLGSSQMVTVKRAENLNHVSVSWQLGKQLGPGTEIVDLSAGGQQVVESMTVLLGSFDQVRPARVVIGLGIFSMTRSRVRDSIPAAFGVGPLRAEVEANLPEDLDAERRATLLAVAPEGAVVAAKRGETLQQRADRRTFGWLAESVRAVANRRLLYNELVDGPLRRDLVAWVGRTFRGRKTARTHLLGKPYPVSLDALAAMQRACSARGVELLVVILPFDSSREPVLYRPQDHARVTADLEGLADRTGFHLLDLTKALGPEHFGDFTDGSPDGAHFDAQGHAIVAARISDQIRSEANASQR